MIPLHKPFMPPDIDEVMEPLRKVLESGWIGEGPRVVEFEERISAFVGSRQVTALNSCTSAIQLALRLAGVGVGDEVITTAMTCMATNEPIILTGATPVFADVQPDTGNIDPDSIEEHISLRTRAIIVVHWGGYPCDMDRIHAIARNHGLRVIEDAAHALGSWYRGQPIGSHSDFACFSFQAIKHITTGDGGLLVCRDEADHKRARSLKWFGIDREKRVENELGIAEWDIVEAGYKYHMNDIAATIGLAQLPYLTGIIGSRRDNAQYYRESLAAVDRIQLLRDDTDRASSYWLFTLLVENRADFVRYMRENEVACSIIHTRNDRHSIFANYNTADLNGLDDFSSRMACIPVGPWVSEADREKIVQLITAQSWDLLPRHSSPTTIRSTDPQSEFAA